MSTFSTILGKLAKVAIDAFIWIAVAYVLLSLASHVSIAIR